MSLKHEHKDGNMNNLFRDVAGGHHHPHHHPGNHGNNHHLPGGHHHMQYPGYQNNPAVGYHHQQQQSHQQSRHGGSYGSNNPSLMGGMMGHGHMGGPSHHYGGSSNTPGGGMMKMPAMSPQQQQQQQQQQQAGYPPHNSQPNVNYCQYRDSRAKSPPTKSSVQQQQQPPSRGILDELDEQAAGYKDDRIQNELLKEICSDIGIDDAMDLDIFDFDAPADNYYNPQQTRLSDFGLDQTAPFGDLPGGEEMSKTPVIIGDHHQKDAHHDPSITKLPLKTEPGEMSPYTQSVPSVKSSSDYNAAVDSPTVSSSVPGNGQDYVAVVSSAPTPSGGPSQPDSSSSSLGSPSVHSTTPYYESLKPPSSVESLKNPSSVDSVSSQSSSSLQRTNRHGRQDSVDSTASCPHKTGSVGSPMSPAVSNTNLGGSQSNMSLTNHRSLDNLVGVDSPGGYSNHEDDANDRTLVDDPHYTSSFRSDVFTCYSQPSSPAKGRASQQTPTNNNSNSQMYKAQSMNDMNLHRHAIHRLHSQQNEEQFVNVNMKTEKDYESHTDDHKASQQSQQGGGEFKVPHDVGKISSSTSVKTENKGDQGYGSLGSQSTGSGSSHYGSSSNLSHASVPSSTTADIIKDTKQFNNNKSSNQQGARIQELGDDQSDSKLEVFSMPSTADLNIPTLHSDTPSNSSSQSNSPTSMHVAKRARVINSGSDLLEEMRERYMFTKGADMYAPSTHQYPGQQQIPVQRVRPTPQMQPSYQSSGMNPTRVAMQTQVPSQFDFSSGGGGSNNQRFVGPNGSNMNMNNNSQAMMQRKTMYGNNSMPGGGPNMGYGGGAGGGTMQMSMYSSGGGDGAGSNNCVNNTNNVNNASHFPSQSSMDMSARQGGAGQAGMAGGHMVGSNNLANDRLQEGVGGVGGAMQMSSNESMNMQQQQQGMGPRPPVAGARMSSNVNVAGRTYGQAMNYGGGGGSNNIATGDQGGRGCNSPLSPGKVYHNLDNSNRQFEGGCGPQNQPYQSRGGGNQTQYAASHYMNTGGYPGNTGPGPNYRSQPTPGYTNNNNSGNMSVSGQTPGIMNMGGMNNTQMGVVGNNRLTMGSDGHFGDGPNMSMRLPVQTNQQQQPYNKMQDLPGGSLDMGSSSGGGGGGVIAAGDSMSLISSLPRPTPGKLAPPPEGLMQQIISDRSSAFRSHPLFPLLRDLIIADMNFHTPSFPFQLIANLPADFDKLLHNYLNRNPPMRNVRPNAPIEQVIMDALKYAHQSLIEKIQVKKEEVGYQETPKPLSAIEDFCERFDRAVKNSMTPKPSGPLPQGSTSKALPPKTPTKAVAPHQGGGGGGAAPCTPKKDSTGRGESKTDSEKAAGGSTPTSKGTAGRNKVLPKEAVALMLDWLREHQDNPYPNDDEKEMLIAKTKLTINQINYWFTNARRRILPKWALQRYMEQQQHSPYGPRLTPM